MDITFACQKCGQHIVIDENGAGQLVDCPKCGTKLVVPNESKPADTPQPVPTPPDKKCPFCAEMIHAEAIKCKHCGEFLDSSHRVQTAPLPVPDEKSELPAPKTTGGAKKVNNIFAWLVAFTPVVSTFLQVLIAGALSQPAGEFWWIALALNIGLCLVDENQLSRAGQNTKNMTGWAFLIPVYLFVRAKRLNQKKTYAYVWIVMFVLSLMLNEEFYAAAQYNVGVCYANGQGVTKDEAKAVKWYRKAAEQGDSDAQNNLGVCYANGEGVTKDEAEAVRLYRKAADHGNAMAQNNLGAMYDKGLGVTKDVTEAVKWYRMAAEQGNATAQNNLGFCYANGQGATKDEPEAVKWYRKAVEQGNATAQNNLGTCYANGRGVTKDEAEAVRLFRKAVEQDYILAEYNLGRMYLNGLGVTKDEIEALKWFRKSAERGNVLAQGSLGRMYDKGLGVTKDDAEALKWYHRAAEQGDADFMNIYAWLLLTTTNLSLHNDKMALEYAQKAVANTEWEKWNKLDTLALAWFQCGNTSQAIRVEKASIELLPENMPEDKKKEFQDRLNKFEAAQK